MGPAASAAGPVGTYQPITERPIMLITEKIQTDAYRAITAAMVADIMSGGEQWSADTLDEVYEVLVNRGELDEQ